MIALLVALKLLKSLAEAAAHTLYNVLYGMGGVVKDGFQFGQRPSVCSMTSWMESNGQPRMEVTLLTSLSRFFMSLSVTPLSLHTMLLHTAEAPTVS